MSTASRTNYESKAGRPIVPTTSSSVGSHLRDYGEFAGSRTEEEEELRDATFKDVTWNALKQGYYNSLYGKESYRAMMGGENERQKYEEILAGEDYQFAPSNAFEEAISGAANLLGQQVSQWTDKRSLAAAGTAGTAAFIAGQAGPQVLLPEEVITVPAAAIAGLKAGSAVSNFEIEAGLAYNEMLEKGVSEETARKVALGVGGVNAGLELLQMDELVKSFKILKNNPATEAAADSLGKRLFDMGVDITKSVGKETAQEVAQEGSTIAGTQFATKHDTGEWAYDTSEVLGRLGDTAKSSALSFGVMNVPHATVGTYNAVRANKIGSNYSGDISALVDEGLQSDQNSESYKIASRLKTRLDNGGKVSNTEAYDLAVANQREINREASRRPVDNSSPVVESAVEGNPVPSRMEVYRNRLTESGMEATEAETVATSIERILNGDTSITNKDKDVLSVGKKEARAIFEEETGMKLPASNSSTRKAISEYIAQTAVKHQEQKTETTVAENAKVVSQPPVNVMSTDAINQLKGNAFNVTASNAEATLRQAAEVAASRAKSANINTVQGDMVSLGTNGQRVYQKHLQNARSVSNYSNAFQRYYDAGQIGLPFESIKTAYDDAADRSVLFEAYSAGQNDASAADKGKVQSEKKIAQRGKKMPSRGKGKFYDTRSSDSTSVSGEVTKTLERFAKVFNVDIELVDSITDSNGRSIANGYYKDGKIVLAADSDNPLITVLKHEVTHHLQKTSPKQYKEFKDYVMKAFYGNSQEAMNAEIQRRIDLAHLNNVKLTRAEAMDEIVADATESFLTDRDSIDALVKENRSLAETILNAIRDVLKKIESAMKGENLKGYSDFMNADQLKVAEKMWVEALAAAADGREVGVNFAEITESSAPVWSLKSMKFDLLDGQMQRDLVEHGIMTVEESQNLMDNISKLIDDMSLNAHILDMNEEYTKGNRPFNVYKPNSDPLYKVSLDFSTLCKKRLMTQFVMESLQTKLGKALSAKEQLAIRSKLEEYGKTNKQIQVACALCYVEARRLKAPDQINRFLDDRATILTDYFGKKNKAYKQTVDDMADRMKVDLGYKAETKLKNMKPADKKKVNEAKQKMMKQYIPTAEEQKIIERANAIENKEFLSQAGLTNLSLNDPVIYDAFVTHVRNATKSKALESGVPYYYGDSKSVSDALIEAMNAENGLRHQSWSDFEIVHLLDNIAAVIELSVRKAKMHAYTKVPDFVKVNGNTGIMINLSLIPAGKTGIKDGKLDFSPTEGMDYQVAVDLRKQYHKTTGTIAIGIDDQQIDMMLNDETIDYVIPYHTSGMNAQLRKMAGISGWADYETYQNEKEKKGAKQGDCPDELWHKKPDFSEWFDTSKLDMSKSGVEIMKEAAGRYLVLCEERGLTPKFSDTKKHTDFSKHDNYWKLLIDRKMVDKDGNIIIQQAVRPDFDFDIINQVIKDEVKNYDPTLLDSINAKVAAEWESGGIKQREKELLAEEKKAKKAKKKAAKVANGLLEQVVMPEGAQASFKEYTPVREKLAKAELDKLSGKLGEQFPLSARFDSYMKNTSDVVSSPTIKADSVHKGNKSYYKAAKDEFIKNYKKDETVNMAGTGIVAKLDTEVANESMSKRLNRGDEQVLLDIIPHAKDLIEGGKLFGIERIAHTGNKKSGLFAYRVYNAFDYETADPQTKTATTTPYVFVATVVQQYDGDSVVHIIRGIEVATYDRGKLGKSEESSAITGGKYKVSHLYKYVNAVSRDNGGLMYTPQEDADYKFHYTETEDGRQYSFKDSVYAPTFYSQMERVVEGVKQEKLGAASVVSMLRGKGVKAEEIKWSGIETWLEGKKSVTKQELLEFIRANQLQIEEETLDESETPYTAEQQEEMDYYIQKKGVALDRLVSLWEETYQEKFPFHRDAAGIGDLVQTKLRDKLLEAREKTAVGIAYKEASKALKDVIAKNEAFGFDNEREAYKYALRNPIDFVKSEEMSAEDAAVFESFAEAQSAFRSVDLNSLADANAQMIQVAADQAHFFSKKIGEIKSANRAERAKHLPRWTQYRLAGGTNYREYLYKMPNSDYSNSAMYGHWNERAGILAHARVQDIENSFTGWKTLFIEEIQSDWHNAGAKLGYDLDKKTALANIDKQIEDVRAQMDSIKWPDDSMSDSEYYKAHDAAMEESQRLEKKLHQLRNDRSDLAFNGTPSSAPYSKTYHEFVLKNLLRKAAEGGYNSLGWTTGKIQENRWSSDYAEGYRIEYDQDIPKFLNKYGKQWGTKVEKSTLEDGTEIWSMDITDAMRESVLYEGQPQYQLKTPDEMVDIASQIRHEAKAVTDAEIMSQAIKDMKLTGVERDIVKNYQNAMKTLADYEKKLAVYEATKAEHSKGRSVYTDASGKVKKSGVKYSAAERDEIQRKVEWWKRRLREIEQKEEFKKILKREKAKMAETHARKMSDLRTKYNQRLDALRGQRDAKVEAEKQRMRDYKQFQRDSKEYKALKGKLEADVKWLDERLRHPTDAKHIPEDFKKGVAAFLKSLDFETKHTDSYTVRNGVPSQKVINLRAMREVYENILKDQSSTMELDEIQLEALRELEKICANKRVADLDYAELGLVRDAIQYIKMSVASADKAFNKEIKESISAMGEALIREQRSKKAKKDRAGFLGEGDKLMNYDNVAPADKFHEFGGVMEKLYHQIRKGFDQHINNVQTAIGYTQKLTEGNEAAIKEWSGDKAKTSKFQISDGTTIELTPAQVMSLYCLMKRDQAVGHVLGSGIVPSGVVVNESKKYGKVKVNVAKKISAERASRCTIEDIQKIVDTLTDDQKKIADGVVKLFTTKCADWGNETSMKLYGYKKFNEKNYFPIRSSDAYLNARFDDSGDVLIKNLGFTKNTVVNANNPIVVEDIFDVLADHVNKMSMYNALVVPLTDFTRVFNYKSKGINKDGEVVIHDSVQKALETSGGNLGIQYIKQFMKDVNKQANSLAAESFINKSISRYKKAKIAASARVLLQQPTAIARAGAMVDPKYLIKGLQQKANYKEMFDHSEIAYWKSLGFYQTDMGRNMKDILLDNETALDRLTMGMYGKADDFAWGHLWNAIKLEQADAHPDMDTTSSDFLDLVSERFEEVIDRTQVVDSVFHRSQIMRAQGAATKVATAFMAEPTKAFNLLRTDLIDSANSKDYSKFKRSVVTYAANAVLVSAFAGIADMIRDDEDEDDEGNKRNLWDKYRDATAKNIATNINPLGMIPYIKEINSMLQGYDVNRMEMASLAEFVKTAKKWTQGKYSYPYLIKETAEDISELFGIPLKNVIRDMTALVRTAGDIVGGHYYADYMVDKMKYNIANSNNRSVFYKHYTDALLAGDEAAAEAILADMVVNGIPYDNIVSKGYQKEKEVAFSEARKLIASGKADEAKKLIRELAKQYDKKFTTLWKAVKNGDSAGDPEDTYDFKDLQKAVRKGEDTELIEDYLTEYGGYSEEDLEEAVKLLTEKYK